VSYDRQVRTAIDQALVPYLHEYQQALLVDMVGSVVAAIPPGTVVDEAGRFAKAEKAYLHKSGEWLYRIARAP
jgi:hypothetical protein